MEQIKGKTVTGDQQKCKHRSAVSIVETGNMKSSNINGSDHKDHSGCNRGRIVYNSKVDKKQCEGLLARGNKTKTLLLKSDFVINTKVYKRGPIATSELHKGVNPTLTNVNSSNVVLLIDKIQSNKK